MYMQIFVILNSQASTHELIVNLYLQSVGMNCVSVGMSLCVYPMQVSVSQAGWERQ